MKRTGCAIGAALVLAWPQLSPMAAQTTTDRQLPQFRTRSDMVEVYATVTRREGASVTDLRGEEFELFEDGVRREIAVFSALVQPLSVAIILDHSGSTDSEFAQVVQAAGAFVGRLFKEDRARISTLASDCSAFTGDRKTLIDALQKRLPRDPGSPIWSATDRAMSALEPESGRRVILLLSDGADNQEQMANAPARSGRAAGPSPNGCSRADLTRLVNLPEVIDRAERESVMVYTVAVPSNDPNGGVAFGAGSSMGTAGGSPSSGPPPLLRSPLGDLSKLAKRSGGSEQQLTNYSQLDAAFKVIADELHLQYLLGFVPSKFDGKRHEITVRVNRPGVTVRAREAYIAQRR